ncbi:glycosyl hydrolase family 28-related protein [Peribacillus sp. SCS-155]|uniref:glycosyl hydrolase family 28-related protein n=1 Tax=Peribacillus sedimenti TaxID=3115297 RepID=UPI003906699E
MLYLDRQHNPEINGKFITELLDHRMDLREAIRETDSLFRQNASKWEAVDHSLPGSFLENMVMAVPRLILSKKAFGVFDLPDTLLDQRSNVFPDWMPVLDEQYDKLHDKIDRIVNVKDFGAAGDGVTDDTRAFAKAIGNGRVKVLVPEGVYITKGIRLPSWTCLVGEGKGVTVIRLHEQAPRGTRLVSNRNYRRGNRNILVEGMTLDWNVERLGDVPKTSTWGNHSSCLLFANVKYGWVRNVEGINPGLHCFDISSTLYDYSGDGYRAKGGSNYIWLDKLNGYGFGDDGITTHHSDNIFISHCHMCDPSGRAHKEGFSNSNGIEVDDGSRSVLLVNNSTTRCFGGVEIKAHHNSSAANNVQIIGHISVNDNRSFNFRHIGHHKVNDPESRTAHNIRATNLVAIAPVHTSLYEHSSPRGMVVSAYKNVVINNFTLIGDPEYDFGENPVIAIQYRARNVILRNVSIRDFKNANSNIKVFGGEQCADDIQIRNVRVKNAAAKAVDVGNGIQNIKIDNVDALA